MVNHCVVLGCNYKYSNRTRTPETQNVSLHAFPSESRRRDLREAWIKAVRRDGWKPSLHSAVCSQHFRPEDMDFTGQTRRLKDGAVPSVFPTFPKYLHNARQISRQSPKCRASKPVELSKSDVASCSVHEPLNNDVTVEQIISSTHSIDGESESPLVSGSELTPLKKLCGKFSSIDMPGCAAFGCSNRTENGYSLKVFPRDPERRALWTAMINRKNWTPTNTSYICEKHFADNQWEVARVDGKKKLKANAVPTIFEISRKRNSNVKKKRGRKCKGLGKSDEGGDGIDETNTNVVMERLKCFVCCCPLVSGHEVNLHSLTTTTGVTMQQRLTGISYIDDEKLQRHKNDEMELLCNRCARLINYVDKMEAELALLKSAISGCLQVKKLNGDSEQLGPDFISHVLVLDEFDSNLSGSNFDESKSNHSEEDHLRPDVNDKRGNKTEVSSELEDLGRKNNFLPSNMLQNGDGEVLQEDMKNTADKPCYQCQICLIKTTSRSVLFFHLRKHMATYQWCDFCDIPLKSIEDETIKVENVSSS